MLKGKGAPHLEDIQTQIETAAGNMESVAHIVAMHKKGIFSILHDNLAETTDDETILKNLKDSLEKKKTKFETDLGKGGPNKIDLTKNDELIKFWEDKIKSVNILPVTTTAQNDDIKQLIKKSLDQIQHLDEFDRGRTLFGGKTFNISDIKKNIKMQEIAEILNETDDTKIKNKIDIFIKGVKKTKHPFHIQHSKLYTMPDTQRETAIRIALYLYCINQMIDKKEMTQAMYPKIKKILEDQIINEEIFKIKGIYNVKKELENVVPEHDTLHDINQKAGDMDLGAEKYGVNKIVKTQNLTAQFENGIAKDLENYALDQSKISTNPFHALKLTNIFGDINNTIDTNINDLKSFDVNINIGGKRVKLGEIGINNKHGGAVDAQYNFEMVELSAIQAQLTPAEIAATFPLDLIIPITGIKNVYNAAKGKVGLTKNIKIKLEIDGGGPVPVIGGIEHVTSTISNITQINRAVAEREAGELLRKRYKKTKRYKPRSRPDKLNLFLRRQFIKDRLTDKLMKKDDGLHWDEKDIDAADRHELEKEAGFNTDIENLKELDTTNFPHTRAQLDILIAQYTGTAPAFNHIDKNNFITKFTDILTQDPPLDPELPKMIKKNNMSQISTNIERRIDAFREHQIMVGEISTHITANPLESPAALSGFCRPRIKKYIETYKTYPKFLSEKGIKLDDANNGLLQLRALQLNTGALTQIAARTLQLKIQILNKGEEAYNVKQKEGTMTKVGKRLDNPFAKSERLNRHPAFKQFTGRMRGLTKLSAVVVPGIFLAPVGPLAVAGWAGGSTFIQTFFKKFAHYNKEHIGYQRNQAVKLKENSKEREDLMNEVGKFGWAKRNALYYFGLGKTARKVRQYRDYVQTTHDQLSKTWELNDNLKQLNLTGEMRALNTNELFNLEKYVSDGLARLDFHAKEGQNFLGSEKAENAEKDYRELYRRVEEGIARLGTDNAKIRNNMDYKTTMKTIRGGTGAKESVQEIGYDKARNRFTSRKREKAIWGAMKAGAMSFGLSYLASSLLSRGPKGEHTIDAHGHWKPDIHKESLFVKGDVNGPIHSSLATNPPGSIAGIDINIHAGVDKLQHMNAIAANAELTSKIASNNAFLSANFPVGSPNYIKLHEIINSPDVLSGLKNFAASKGADTGNQALFANRMLEGLETTMREMVSTGHKAAPIGAINFDAAASTVEASVARAVGNETARTMGVDIVYSTLQEARNIGVALPVPMNTFKEEDYEPE